MPWWRLGAGAALDHPDLASSSKERGSMVSKRLVNSSKDKQEKWGTEEWMQKRQKVANKGSVRKGRLNPGERQMGRTGKKKSVAERGSWTAGKCSRTGSADARDPAGPEARGIEHIKADVLKAAAPGNQPAMDLMPIPPGQEPKS